MRVARFTIAFLLAALLPLGAIAAPPAFGPLPTKDGKHSKVKLRVVEYTGSTNGGMVVEVRNDGPRKTRFTAKGLFFVPDVNPDDAPQRLGAAGPFEQKTPQGWAVAEELELAPGQIERLKVQVFCIDSHRSSPSSSTPFRLAQKRLPKDLTLEIEQGTQKLMKARKAPSAKSVSSDVQGHVWQTRNKKWIKLEGERTDEKSPQNDIMQQRQERSPFPIQRRKEPLRHR